MSVTMESVPIKVMKRQPDELVMTSCRRGNQSQVRIERLRQDQVQHHSAVYIGDGPFTGVVIQDPTVGMAPVSAPDMHFGFVASLSEKGSPQQGNKERREIMFWFKPKTGSKQKIQQVKDYFRELIAPENFPRDFVGFIKKNITLAKQYPSIRRIDVVTTPLPPDYGSDSGYLEDNELDSDVEYRRRLAEIRGRYHVQENVINETRGQGPATARPDTPPAPKDAENNTYTDARGSYFTERWFIPPENEIKQEQEVQEEEQQELEQQEEEKIVPQDETDYALSPAQNGNEGAESTESVVDEDEDEGEGMIENFITVLTPSVYDYQYLPEVPVSGKTHITFRVRAWADAHIALSSVYGDTERKTYEVVLGAFGNTRSIIRDGGMGHIVAEERTRNILNGQESLPFWISWSRDRVDVGRGVHRGSNRIMRWRVPENKQHSVNCLAVSTGPGSKGEWEFVEYIAPQQEETESKAARRARFRVSLLWLAKKQKMLNVLEDAYPSSVETSELLKITNIKLHDMMTAVVFLKDLQKRGLITELGKGVWMRAPGSIQDKSHEVRMVRDLPMFTGRDNPTIAIVTTLYCEKLAVDAMMDQKISYIRYKKDDECLVYTVGRVADQRVVSTKLARVGSGRTATIAAGNSVTRLLGTFGRVEHVIMVGVGGGVPHYTDYDKHARLGDVVVSVPTRSGQPIYVHCDQVTQPSDNNKHDFTVRTWPAGGTTLQNIVGQLKSLNNHEGAWARPWERYMDEGLELLDAEVSSFHRPAAKTDKLYAMIGDELLQVEHPKPPPGWDMQRELVPHIRFGPIGSGRYVARNETLRMELALKHTLSAYTVDHDAVLEAIKGSRRDSFLMVRGIADYADGTKNKDWQPYAALAAAAYTKAIIAALPSQTRRSYFR